LVILVLIVDYNDEIDKLLELGMFIEDIGCGENGYIFSKFLLLVKAFCAVAGAGGVSGTFGAVSAMLLKDCVGRGVADGTDSEGWGVLGRKKALILSRLRMDAGRR
jgi:hypothetical protein